MSDSDPTQRFDALLEGMLTKPPHELPGEAPDGHADQADDAEN